MPETQKLTVPVWLSAIKQILISAVLAYFAVVFLTFAISSFASLTGLWPSTWQVPWSGLGSFIETKDDRIVIHIKMWGRIEVYDSSGHFVDSWKAPAIKGDMALATDENGNVYFRHANTIFKLDNQGRVASKFTSAAPVPRNWILSAQTGEPQYASVQSAFIQRKIATRGEFLFSDAESQDFLCQDESRLERRGSSLIRVSHAGERLQFYSAPCYYYPLQFPFPAVLGWIAGFAVILLRLIRPV